MSVVLQSCRYKICVTICVWPFDSERKRNLRKPTSKLSHWWRWRWWRHWFWHSKTQSREAHMLIRGESLQTSMCIHLLTLARVTCSRITCTVETQQEKKEKNTVWMSIEYYSVNWSSDTSETDWLWMWRCFMATMNEMAWCGVSDFLKVKFWDVSSWTSEAGGVAHLSLLQRLAAIKFQARTTPPKKCTPFFFLAHISADEAVDSAP